MDVNSIKTAIEAASTVNEIKVLLEAANDNDIIFDSQYLQDLVSQQSVQVENKTGITLLYSGGIQTDGNGATISHKDGGYQAWQVAKSIGLNNDQVLTIDQTDTAVLLNSDEFKFALNTSDPVNYNKIMDGVTENGTRTHLGLWDITSQRLADSATGDVRTITPFSTSAENQGNGAQRSDDF
jgi:hypothetical protein